ncbi:hypothetical protein Hanom_Chr05g00446621 [Helianthus anomalus]
MVQGFTWEAPGNERFIELAENHNDLCMAKHLWQLQSHGFLNTCILQVDEHEKRIFYFKCSMNSFSFIKIRAAYLKMHDTGLSSYTQLYKVKCH